jgi:hypothetical protein
MNDKYLIFLPNKYRPKRNVGCMCLKKYKDNIINILLDKGISIRYRDDIRGIISSKNKTFDDEISPKLNTLYIHLTGGDYYSDNLYSKKKTEREREILFLLAAKLGASKIIYETDIIETQITKANSRIKTNNIDINATYSRKINNHKGKTGKEIYSNRGAPVYTLSKNINQVEDNIRTQLSKLNSKIFSYDFYENNNRLKSFVYKRFNFKINHIEYTSEVDTDIDIFFDVKTTLLSYGIGISFEKQIIQIEKVSYCLNFYEDKELRLKLSYITHLVEDPFAIIREIYNDDNNKETAVFYITEFARKFSNKCKVSYICENGGKITENYNRKLNDWINSKGSEKFTEECRKFTSSYQIRIWFKENLIEKNEQIIDDFEDNDGPDSYGILKVKKNNYEIFKQNIIADDNYSCCNFLQGTRKPSTNDSHVPLNNFSLNTL